MEKQNSRLKEENEYLKRKLFGTKSETSRSLGFEQLSLFNEAEAEANPKEEQFIVEEVSFKRKKKVKGCLDDKLSKLPQEDVILELPESELKCPKCGSELVKIGTRFVRREIESILGRLKVKNIYVTSYECHPCRKKKRALSKQQVLRNRS